ncbi:MAG: PspC domain-containing protein [Methanocorpusculum sp.]|nr:PspC domain-containing protein [Methanocorpusculum sp.]
MTEKTLYRSQTDRFIGGVCGGIAEYAGIPSWLVRVITVILVFVPIPVILVIVVYLVLWITLPLNPSRRQLDPNTIDADYEVKD